MKEVNLLLISLPAKTRIYLPSLIRKSGPKGKEIFLQNNLMEESIPPSPINKVRERAGLF